ARRSAEDHTEAVEVVARRSRRHHLNGAAGDAEKEVPQRRLARSVDDAVELRREHPWNFLSMSEPHHGDSSPFLEAPNWTLTASTHQLRLKLPAHRHLHGYVVAKHPLLRLANRLIAAGKPFKVRSHLLLNRFGLRDKRGEE